MFCNALDRRNLQLGHEDSGQHSRGVLLRLRHDADYRRNSSAETRRKTADAVRCVLDGVTDTTDSRSHHRRRLRSNVHHPPTWRNWRGRPISNVLWKRAPVYRI